MISTITLLAVLALALPSWFLARIMAGTLYSGYSAVHSIPNYHGWHVALWIVVPAFVSWGIWGLISPGLIEQMVLDNPAAAKLPSSQMERHAILAEAAYLASNPDSQAFNPLSVSLISAMQGARHYFDLIGALLIAVVALASGSFAFSRVHRDFPARTQVERAVLLVLLLAALVAVFTTIGIILSLAYETTLFFTKVSIVDFLTGLHWSPRDGTGPEIGKGYGAVPLFWGTLFIGAIIAMLVAIPFGLMSAIYLTQYASTGLRRWAKPLLEILAGVPTVVYGYFAALTVAPMVRDLGLFLGMQNPSAESALAAGLVMGVMIIPFVSSMADDSIAAVPQAMRDGSLAMGATTSETIRRVLIPAALPGIVAGVMLAVSRAIGETMIVVMAAGAVAKLSANPFESMTTVTYQIVQLLTGDQEFDSPRTLSAFALGLVLFLVTLIFNIIALRIVKRFREAYE